MMGDEAKESASSRVDFWKSGKAVWSPAFAPRKVQGQDETADTRSADAKKDAEETDQG